MRSRENARRRGHTLIEVLVAIVVLTIVFMLISSDMMALSHSDKAADETVEIAAANYYLGFMKTDQNFWQNVALGTGPTDDCGNQLGPYTNTYPSPPAQAQWNDFQYCQGAPAFVNPNDPSPQPETMQYMWSATQRLTDPNVADLTVWVRRDASSPVYEYHAMRYLSPSLVSPSPYASSPGSPSPTPTVTPTPPGSPPPPTPTPKPTPSHSPTPKPSPTPIGI